MPIHCPCEKTHYQDSHKVKEATAINCGMLLCREKGNFKRTEKLQKQSKHPLSYIHMHLYIYTLVCIFRNLYFLFFLDLFESKLQIFVSLYSLTFQCVFPGNKDILLYNIVQLSKQETSTDTTLFKCSQVSFIAKHFFTPGLHIACCHVSSVSFTQGPLFSLCYSRPSHF